MRILSLHPLWLVTVLAAASAACGGDPDTVPLSSSSSGAAASSSSGDINTGECELSGAGACSACTERSCRSQAEACFCPASGADNCDAYLDGQVDCEDASGDAGTPDECNAALETRLPLGAAASKALEDCQATQCKTDCGF